MATSPPDEPADQRADVLVVFGITGDLAKKMTLARSTGSSAGGCSTCRSSASPSRTGRSSTCATTPARRSPPRGESLDEAVFERFAARLAYVSGDFTQEATFERLAQAVPRPAIPSSTSRSRRRCSPPWSRASRRRTCSSTAPASSSRSRSGTTSPRRARWPAICTATSTSRSCYASTTSSGRWASRRSSTCASPTRSLEPVWNRSHIASRADHDGRSVRGGGPRALLRSGRRAARRRRQPPPAGPRGDRDGAAGGERPRDHQRRARRGVPGDAPRGPGALRPRSVRGLPRDRRGRARLDDRDLRRAAGRHRQLALGGGALLHPLGQAARR